MIYREMFKLTDNLIISIEADEAFITRLSFSSELFEENSNELTHKASDQLHEFFAGERESFDLPLRPEGSAFQQKVWKALLEIPKGKVATYQQIALQVGGKNYARAVGMACNKNPLPIFIPCHRVVGTKGSLTGYAGGIPLKEKLLQLENVHL